MASLVTARATLATAVTNTSTVVIAYPSGWTQARLLGTTGGSLTLANNERFPQAASGAGTVAFTFGASDITITNNSGITWPAFAEIIVGFGTKDEQGRYTVDLNVTPGPQVLTAATGTPSTTIADVGGSFTQATLNNNFKSLADQLNLITNALKAAGIVP